MLHRIENPVNLKTSEFMPFFIVLYPCKLQISGYILGLIILGYPVTTGVKIINKLGFAIIYRICCSRT